MRRLIAVWLLGLATAAMFAGVVFWLRDAQQAHLLRLAEENRRQRWALWCHETLPGAATRVQRQAAVKACVTRWADGHPWITDGGR